MTPQETQTFLADREVAYDAYLAGRKAEAYQILIQYLCLDQCQRDFKNVELQAQPPREPRVGDVLVCDWGWEQTNIDFYEVTKVVGKASVQLRRLHKNQVANHTYDVEVIPVFGAAHLGEKPLTKRWKTVDGAHWRYSCRISDGRGSARLWDGIPCRETAAGYGH